MAAAAVLAVVMGIALAVGPEARIDRDLARGYAELPVAFEVNHGQADPAVRYVARASGYAAFLTDSGAVVVPTATGEDGGSAAVTMRFAGADPRPQIDGVSVQPGVANYLLGDDPADWVTNVPTYASVTYRDVYPGIDAIFRDDDTGQVAYDLVVAPGGDPSVIALEFSGADQVTLDGTGDLVLATPAGALRQSAPVVYQDHGEARREVAGAFILLGEDLVGFDLGDYDPTLPLVIDPVLTYSTYLGGVSVDHGNAIAVDDDGAAYVAGSTVSLDFPVTAGAAQTTNPGATSAFVAKLLPDGSALAYATYLGGTAADVANGIAVDGNGAAYVAGETRSANFPTLDAAQDTHGGGICPTAALPNQVCRDAFLTKLTPSGAGLEYSTFLGGEGDDFATGVAVDAAQAAYLAGTTAGTDFPTTPGALQEAATAGNDAFAAKVTADGSAFAYATYLGGGAADGANGIAVDDAGAAYLTGTTASADFPTTGGSVQPAYPGAASAFVSKLAADGTALAYSTFLGGTSSTYLAPAPASSTGAGIAVDGAGAAYVVGQTGADDFPTQDAFQAGRAGETDAYVSKLTPDGSALDYATYLGGPSADAATAVGVDDTGAAYVTGTTAGGGFPSVGQVATYAGAFDTFVAKLAPDGSALDYSTHLGGPENDLSRAIAVHPGSGAAYVTGSTNLPFPVLDPVQAEPVGTAITAFVARIDGADDGPRVTRLEPRSGPAAGATAVVITGSGFTEDAQVHFGGVPAADLRFESATELLALSPPGDLGTVPVTVTTSAGTSPDAPIARFEYAEGVWLLTGEMDQARFAHTTTLLDDGRVLVAGGRASNQGPTITAAEVYDPETDTWEATGSLTDSRFSHAAALLPDGRVMVTGGFTTGPITNAQPVLDSTEIWDPATGEWTVAGPLNVRRSLVDAHVLNDGRVMIAGGRTCDLSPPDECNFRIFTDAAEIFDPDTEQWTLTSSMIQKRHTNPSITLADGRVLHTGGFGGLDLPVTSTLATTEIYDPETEQWEASGALNAPQLRSGTALLDDDRVLVMGGFPSHRLAEVWNPATGEWSTTGSLATMRQNHYTAALPSGDVLVAGGGNGGFDAELYDDGSGTWRSAGVMNFAHGNFSNLGLPVDGILLDDGSVLVAGNSDHPVAERYVQDPAPDQLPPLPTPTPTPTPTVSPTPTPTPTVSPTPTPTPGEDLCAPPVPAADFTDRDAIPATHRTNVDCAALLAIVSGFGDGSYGPTLEVRRDQMASFIARGLQSLDVALPAPGGERFTDVPAGSTHDDAIHRLAAAGIVQGGAGGLPATAYGPSQLVRRDQMGSFLVRAAEFATDVSFGSQTQAFPDVGAGNAHFANVNAAAELGLAQGFGDGTYRPGAGVRRDQMATFIIRMVTALADGTIGGVSG